MVSVQAIQLLMLTFNFAVAVQTGDAALQEQIDAELRAQAARIIGAGCEVMA